MGTHTLPVHSPDTMLPLLLLLAVSSAMAQQHQYQDSSSEEYQPFPQVAPQPRQGTDGYEFEGEWYTVHPEESVAPRTPFSISAFASSGLVTLVIIVGIGIGSILGFKKLYDILHGREGRSLDLDTMKPYAITILQAIDKMMEKFGE